MNKQAFIKQVRNWEFASVRKALAEEPALALHVDKNGKQPLHHCAGINAKEAKLAVADSLKTAKALIEAGADVNGVRIIIDDGEEFRATPLWYAVAWGKNFELSQLLLKEGAQPEGCMWAVCWAEDEPMADLLHSFGAKIDPVFHDQTPLLEIVKAKRFGLLKWLVANGSNINFQDSHGYSALHYAIERNHNLAQIDELLRLRANPSLKARDGTTPMSLAKKLGKTKLAQLLASFNQQ
jgi:ankyrin repeat protein